MELGAPVLGSELDLKASREAVDAATQRVQVPL